MLNRAYSLLTVTKAAEDDDSRLIEGIATTPTADRAGDIVEPKGAEFKLPIPLLWQHDSSKPIGHVTHAKVTAQGIEIKAKLAKIEEEGALKDRLDEAWQSIKSGLVGGLSIGFKPTESTRIEGTYSYRFVKWLWLELSAVTIPANAEATITAIKSIDDQIRAASGTDGTGVKDDSPAVAGIRKTAVPVVKSIKPEERTPAMNIAEQIKSFEETRKLKADRMVEIMEAAATKGETLDAEQTEEYDGLEAEIKSVDAHLKRLRAMEQVQAAQAKSPELKSLGATGTEFRIPAQVKASPKVAPGIRFARVVKCLGMAQGNRSEALQLAQARYADDGGVVGVLKAAVAAGNTGNAGWAGNLVGDETAVFADFVEYLRPQTILGRFGSGGIPALRSVPFRTALLGQSSGGAAYWVGEGKPKPLTKFDFTRTTLDPLKVANIAVLTEEVIRDSSPSAEMLVRDQLAAALRERLDIDFIDPSKQSASGVSPASITYGVIPVPSSGVDADAVRADIQALFGVFIAANNAPTSGVWVMPATVALALSLMMNPLGQPEFPGVSMMGGTLFGLPVIVSEYVPSDSSGAYVALVNASDIYLADEGGIQVDMSREASLQMDDTPGTQDATSGTGTSLVSLWQTNAVGFRCERTINWAARRTGAVAVLSGVNWGAFES